MTVDTFVFELPSPGSWTPGTPQSLRIASHEAGHAVVGVWLGFQIVQARIDRPDIGIDGKVWVEPDFARLREHLMGVLAGPILAPLPASPMPDWPPNPDRFGDERSAAVLVERLDFREKDWDECIAETRNTLALPEVSRATMAVAGALLERGALRGDELRDIVTRSVLESHG